MPDRRGFLGNLIGGAAAGLVLPASIAKASIEVIGDEELISKIEKSRGEIVLANDKALVRNLLSGNFFGASMETLLKLSDRDYGSFLHDHLALNRKYGIPNMIDVSNINRRYYGS